MHDVYNTFREFVAAIPFGLGYLVLVPVTIASIYVSYKQIFTEEGPPPTVLAT